MPQSPDTHDNAPIPAGRGVAAAWRGVSVAYGDKRVVSRVSIALKSGEIHGLVGENGAGKSTLLKAMTGLALADEGDVLVDGRPLPPLAPREAATRGIGMVHQHFLLAGPMSALDNAALALAHLVPRTWGFLDRKRLKRQLTEIAAAYGMDVAWDLPCEAMPVGMQQRVEIIKCLALDAKILLLDEPTAVLTPQEVEPFLEQLRRLKAQGKTLLLVSHKLKEVLSVADDVTVIRRGEVVATGPAREWTEESLATAMVGRAVRLPGNSKRQRAHALHGSAVSDAHEEVLRLDAVSTRKGPVTGGTSIEGVSFSVRKGEIVGVAGVEGNGQSELLRVVTGPAHARREAGASGMLQIRGADAWLYSRADVRRHGVAIVPEDRLKSALVPSMTLAENFYLSHWQEDEFARHGVLKRESLEAATREALIRFDVRPADPGAKAGDLSGGNQQKFVFARELYKTPHLLVAAHPTRGVDVGSIEFIHAQIAALRDSGAGVLLVSSELSEILDLADRILVLFRGRVVLDRRRADASEEIIGLAMGGRSVP